MVGVEQGWSLIRNRMFNQLRFHLYRRFIQDQLAITILAAKLVALCSGFSSVSLPCLGGL